MSVQASGVFALAQPDGSFTLPNAQGPNLVIVASRDGFYNGSTTVNGGTAGVTLLLDPVQVGNNPNYTLANPSSCTVCHTDQFAQWLGSPMSKAGTNTWVYDIYDGTGSPGGMGSFVYTRDSVHAVHNPHSECAACHQPEPWIAQPFRAMDPIGNLSQGAIHGVSCDVCHKVAHIDPTRLNFPGIFPGTTLFNRPDDPLLDHQVQYGSLGDTSVSFPGVMRPSYQSQLRAEVCAACHQDKNDPDDDGDFEEANGVVSEPTYEEWKASPYADPYSPHFATCVDCHMPSYGATQVANLPVSISPLRDPETIRSHRIEGTTPHYLENAVDMYVDLARDASGVDVTVTIDNQHTGHHVPTGVTVRNMILLVEAVRTSDGAVMAHLGAQTVHALGGVGAPAQGYYAGLPGKYYAKVNHDQNGAGPVFFSEATGIQFDSRIPAFAVDVTHYRFDAPPGTGEVEVRARLIYRRAFRALVDGKQWTTDGHGNPLADVQAPDFGHLMESVVAHVQDPAGPGTSYCESGPNSTGAPAQLSATGSASIAANDLTLVASNVPVGTLGLFFVGDTQGSVPLANGTLCIVSGLRRLPTFGPTASRVVTQAVTLGSLSGQLPVQAGDRRYFQCWFRDPLAGGGFADTSDGYSVTFTP